MKTWAKTWGEKMGKKGVILSGPPGCGKTSAAIALANDMEWEVIELNASDAPSGAVIEGIALRAGLFQTFGSKGLADRNLILLDEADNLYERARQSKNKTKNYSDRGGKRAITKTLEQTKQPVSTCFSHGSDPFRSPCFFEDHDDLCIKIKMAVSCFAARLNMRKHAQASLHILFCRLVVNIYQS